MVKILSFMLLLFQTLSLFSQSEKPKIAILIDDVGNSLQVLEPFLASSIKLNFAVLPFLAQTQKCSELIQTSGSVFILHMPMESKGYEEINKRTKGLLFETMSDDELKLNLEKAINSVGSNVQGFNNHMGSKFTSNQQKMRELLTHAKQKKLFFIDSNTYTKTPENGMVENPSQASSYKIAQELEMKTFYNSLFIDNSNEIKDIEKALLSSVSLAKEKGKILIIGHCRENTIKAIQNVKKQMLEQGIEFVYLTELL